MRIRGATWWPCEPEGFPRVTHLPRGGRGRGEDAMSMIRKLAVWSTIAALSFSVHARAFDVRRVVTGIDADNKSNAILDSKITLAPALNDLKWAHLWVTDSYPLSISATDTRDKSVGVSPPENGTQFGVVEIPPSDPAQPAQPLLASDTDGRLRRCHVRRD
jgi:hypothetical protein